MEYNPLYKHIGLIYLHLAALSLNSDLLLRNNIADVTMVSDTGYTK